jgi:hypothetical protein
MRAPCDRSGRSAWLKVVLGLSPDSIPQKYAQTVTSTWTTPIRCSFWGMKGVSTRPGLGTEVPPGSRITGTRSFYVDHVDAGRRFALPQFFM